MRLILTFEAKDCGLFQVVVDIDIRYWNVVLDNNQCFIWRLLIYKLSKYKCYGLFGMFETSVCHILRGMGGVALADYDVSILNIVYDRSRCTRGLLIWLLFVAIYSVEGNSNHRSYDDKYCCFSFFKNIFNITFKYCAAFQLPWHAIIYHSGILLAP